MTRTCFIQYFDRGRKFHQRKPLTVSTGSLAQGLIVHTDLFRSILRSRQPLLPLPIVWKLQWDWNRDSSIVHSSTTRWRADVPVHTSYVRTQFVKALEKIQTKKDSCDLRVASVRSFNFHCIDRATNDSHCLSSFASTIIINHHAGTYQTMFDLFVIHCVWPLLRGGVCCIVVSKGHSLPGAVQVRRDRTKRPLLLIPLSVHFQSDDRSLILS